MIRLDRDLYLLYIYTYVYVYVFGINYPIFNKYNAQLKEPFSGTTVMMPARTNQRMRKKIIPLLMSH